MDRFQDMYAGLQQSNQGLLTATDGLKTVADGLKTALQGLQRSVDAAQQAHVEQEDLRETVHRLETLVMELSQQVRELRDRRNGSEP